MSFSVDGSPGKTRRVEFCPEGIWSGSWSGQSVFSSSWRCCLVAPNNISTTRKKHQRCGYPHQKCSVFSMELLQSEVFTIESYYQRTTSRVR